MILSIVLISIITAVMTNAFVHSSRSVLTANRVREATEEARPGIERMVREIRNVRDLRCVIAATDRRFAFVDESNRTIDFTWSGVQGASLFRIENGVSNTLVGSVNNLLPGAPVFTYYNNADPRGILGAPTVCGAVNTCTPGCAATNIWSIRVDLEASFGTERMQLRSEVHPMNF